MSDTAIVRSTALTIPCVTVLDKSRPSGFPIAKTVSPALKVLESPNSNTDWLHISNQFLIRQYLSMDLFRLTRQLFLSPPCTVICISSASFNHMIICYNIGMITILLKITPVPDPLSTTFELFVLALLSLKKVTLIL